jgi:hypothetical protein
LTHDKPRQSQRSKHLEQALSQRQEQRARGEVPPLPDPCGRSRQERVLRWVAYEDARKRQQEGTATDDELAYLEARRAHLRAFRGRKRARQVAREERQKARQAEAGPSERSGRGGATQPLEGEPRPRLRGPEDLRAFIEAEGPLPRAAKKR